MKTDNEIEKISEFIDNVSDFMKRQKLKFTEKFYEGIDRFKLTFAEQRDLRDKYYLQWKEEENRLYKLITSQTQPK